MIAAALSLAAATILAIGVWIVARADRPAEHPGAETWSPAALAADDGCELDAVEQAALAAATERAVAASLQEAAYAASGRSLTPGWRDLVTPAPQPQLFTGLDVEPARELPIVPGRYTGRHHTDTVEWVLPGYMPPIGKRRLALILGDTQPSQAVRDGA